MSAIPFHHRWLVVAVTVLNMAVIIGIANYCFTLFSVAWLETYGVSRSQLMLAIFVMLVMTGLLSPILGKWLDRAALRLPIILGLCMYCFGLMLLSAATAYWQIIAIYALIFPVGVIISGNLVSQILINRWFVSNKGLALGISSTGTSIGGMIFPALVAFSSTSYSMSSIIFILGAVCAVVMIPLNYYVLRHNPPHTVAANSEPARHSTKPLFTTRSTITSPNFWIPMVVMLPFLAGFTAIQHGLGTYLNDLGYPPTFAGQLLALTAFMMILGKVVYGKLSDHIDHRYLLAFVSVTMIITLSLFLGATAKPVLIAAAVLWGISGGGLLPLVAVVFASRFPENVYGSVMGLVMFFMIVPSFATLYMGWIHDHFGSYDYAFASLIILIMPGIVLVKWLPQRLH